MYKRQLEEPQWDPDKGKDITPDKEVPKDPQITNTGANDAYVFMEVSVPRSEVRTVNDDGSLSEVLMQDLFTYETNEGWTLMRKQSNGCLLYTSGSSYVSISMSMAFFSTS